MTVPSGLNRLNFGCGFDKRDGYLNVDSDPSCSPDILLVDNDLSVLPRGGFCEILALDVLEHIPRVETIGVLLEWADLLVDRGLLRLKTSSIEGVAKQIASESSFRQQYGWTHCLFGTQAHPGDFHFTGFSVTTLRVHLLAAGFDVNRIWLTDKWLLNAEATKSSSWSRLATDSDELSDHDYIDAIYRSALHRGADASGLEFLTTEMAAQRLDRRGALRHVMTSPEHLFVVADQHGFDEKRPRDLLGKALSHTPNVLRPGFRALGRTTRSTSARARRALGVLDAKRSAR